MAAATVRGAEKVKVEGDYNTNINNTGIVQEQKIIFGPTLEELRFKSEGIYFSDIEMVEDQKDESELRIAQISLDDNIDYRSIIDDLLDSLNGVDDISPEVLKLLKKLIRFAQESEKQKENKKIESTSNRRYYVPEEKEISEAEQNKYVESDYSIIEQKDVRKATVEIRVIDGEEYLYVRDGYGRGHKVIYYLISNDKVKIIEEQENNDMPKIEKKEQENNDMSREI